MNSELQHELQGINFLEHHLHVYTLWAIKNETLLFFDNSDEY